MGHDEDGNLVVILRKVYSFLPQGLYCSKIRVDTAQTEARPNPNSKTPVKGKNYPDSMGLISSQPMNR